MGNLVNPLSRILGFKSNLFWGNNFSFNYCRQVYRQKIFKIKCIQRLFKFIFRFLFEIFDIPRAYYNLSLNFIGQANSILNLECNVRNLNSYNMAILLILINATEIAEVAPRFRSRFGIYKLKSRLQYAFGFVRARFERVFIKWRVLLQDLFIQKTDEKLEIKKINLADDKGNIKRKYGKMRLVLKYCQHFEFEKKITKKYLNYKYNLDILKFYLKTKFKMIGAILKLLRLMSNHFFIDVYNVMFRRFFNKLHYNFYIRKIKLFFKKKKISTGSIMRNVNHFCYLALRKGYRINYVIKMVRNSVRFLKIVRGFQMIVSGRFYRRGRAMFKISSLGEIGSHSGKGALMYRNSERVKEYGMCSIKLLFFFRRVLKFMGKIPIRSRWFHYLKFLRANYKIRSEFGYIRY